MTKERKRYAMNPAKLLQLKPAWERFKKNHPKFPKYLTAVSQKGVKEGSLFEFKVTTPDGEELAANVRLKADDIALFRDMMELFQ